MKTVADAVSRRLMIPVGSDEFLGSLSSPGQAASLVLLAQGSGGGRYASQDACVAQALREAGIATLVFSLLTPHEAALEFVAREHRLDLRLLAKRLVDVTDWLRNGREFRDASIGYCTAGTGSAAALIAAAELGRHVAAVVSRGGRPDLAGEALARVEAPTLLIVAGNDRTVTELNELASTRLCATKQVALVAGASHSFAEPGALTQAAALTSQWFTHHLAAAQRPAWS